MVIRTPANWEDVAYPGLADVRLLRAIHGLCIECNHPAGMHWGEDDYVSHRCRQCPERITKDGDFLVCVCSNRGDSGSFEPCMPDGTVVEPAVEGPWQGELYLCETCGRIVNQHTLEVTGSCELK